VIHKGETQHII